MSEPHPPATVAEALAALEPYGIPKLREQNIQRGAPANQFGAKMGDIRIVAKSIKSNHELARQLWAHGNLEAMLLATLIAKPKLFTTEELERMTAEVTWDWLADWLMSYVTKQHPEKESLRQRWMLSDHPMLLRAGWSLTTERVVKEPAGMDLAGLLDRIDSEMAEAPAPAQWTMNFCLGEIGIRYPEHRERAVSIGERIGLYRNYPCSKGCVSPYVPTWVATMVARQ